MRIAPLPLTSRGPRASNSNWCCAARATRPVTWMRRARRCRSLGQQLQEAVDAVLAFFDGGSLVIGQRHLDEHPLRGLLDSSYEPTVDCAAAALICGASALSTNPAFTALSVAAFQAFTKAVCDGYSAASSVALKGVVVPKSPQ